MPFQEATHATWVDHALETAAEPPSSESGFFVCGGTQTDQVYAAIVSCRVHRQNMRKRYILKGIVVFSTTTTLHCTSEQATAT